MDEAKVASLDTFRYLNIFNASQILQKYHLRLQLYRYLFISLFKIGLKHQTWSLAADMAVTNLKKAFITAPILNPWPY